MKTINDNVKIKQYVNDTDGNPWYTLKFDGVIADVPFKPIKEHLYCFKAAILGERERIWDESEEVADNKTMKKLLRME